MWFSYNRVDVLLVFCKSYCWTITLKDFNKELENFVSFKGGGEGGVGGLWQCCGKKQSPANEPS